MPAQVSVIVVHARVVTNVDIQMIRRTDEWKTRSLC